MEEINVRVVLLVRIFQKLHRLLPCLVINRKQLVPSLFHEVLVQVMQNKVNRRQPLLPVNHLVNLPGLGNFADAGCVRALASTKIHFFPHRLDHDRLQAIPGLVLRALYLPRDKIVNVVQQVPHLVRRPTIAALVRRDKE